MPDLLSACAPGAAAPRQARCGALVLGENTALALASLALRRGQDLPALGSLALPGPGGWAEADGIAAFWTGPGQWMVEGPGLAETDFAARVQSAAPGASVTEQTDGFVTFEIASDAGPAPVEALLSHLVNVDPAQFGPGRATRTGLEHMSVFVLRRAADRMALMGMRSAATSLWHVLETAAKRLEGERT